jgi:putative component of membrane protein insertase Oxa1/YidC/SpoIIIJ protein YidD
MVTKLFKVIFLLLVILITTSHPLMSQSLSKDVRNIIQSFPATEAFSVKNEAVPVPLDVSNTSEFKMFFMMALRGYQLFISSQDMPICNFKPSCSRFSQAAFRQAGLFQGFLLTSDRLQRCNGLPGMLRHYELIPGLRRFLDPVESYLHIHGNEKRGE